MTGTALSNALKLAVLTYGIDASLWAGVDKTGATDSAAGLSTAAAFAAAAGLQQRLPAGTYKLASGIAPAAGANLYYSMDPSAGFADAASFTNLNAGVVRPQRLNRNTYGTYDQAAGYAYVVNSGDLPAQVIGISTPSGFSSYASRDSVALFIENSSFAATAVIANAGTTYTATTISFTAPIATAGLRVGMLIDTGHSPKYTGQISAIPNGTTATSITVSGWYQQGNAGAGQVPANGTGANVNPVTKVWGQNTVVQLGNPATYQATGMAGYELDANNNSGTSWTPSYATANPTSPNMWGFDCVNLGANDIEAGFVQRGSTGGSYYGMSVRGATRAAFHIADNGFHPFNGLQFDNTGLSNLALATNGASGATYFQVYGSSSANAGSMEIGSQGTAQTTFLDIHSSGNANDYDVRLQFTGGSASIGQGTMQVNAAVVFLNTADLKVAGSGTPLLHANVAWNNGAAAQTATLTNGPVAGNPTKWLAVNDAGTTRYIPAW